MKSLRKTIGVSKDYQKEIMTRLTSLTSKVQCVIYSYIGKADNSTTYTRANQRHTHKIVLVYNIPPVSDSVQAQFPTLTLTVRKTKSAKERPLLKTGRSSANLPVSVKPCLYFISLPVSLGKEPHLAHTCCCF